MCIVDESQVAQVFMLMQEKRKQGMCYAVVQMQITLFHLGGFMVFFKYQAILPYYCNTLL
jgi:hypothetical protein